MNTKLTRLGAFIDGYIECALWADTPEDARDADAAPETLTALRNQARAFWMANHTALELANAAGRPYDYLGHDFWLSRNGHGTGFWDRDLGEVGDTLHTTAKLAGECNLYVGDDGRLYAEGGL
jgi:hypothetical protein